MEIYPIFTVAKVTEGVDKKCLPVKKAWSFGSAFVVYFFS
jgi:hypothetical protein